MQNIDLDLDFKSSKVQIQDFDLAHHRSRNDLWNLDLDSENPAYLPSPPPHLSIRTRPFRSGHCLMSSISSQIMNQILPSATLCTSLFDLIKVVSSYPMVLLLSLGKRVRKEKQYE